MKSVVIVGYGAIIAGGELAVLLRSAGYEVIESERLPTPPIVKCESSDYRRQRYYPTLKQGLRMPKIRRGK